MRRPLRWDVGRPSLRGWTRDDIRFEDNCKQICAYFFCALLIHYVNNWSIQEKCMYPFEKYKDDIKKICRTYRAKSLVAFGGAISDEFNDNSDIDFLLELTDTENGLSRYMNIKFELETLFNRSVDIVMPKAIKNRLIKTYIFSNVRKLYAA